MSHLPLYITLEPLSCHTTIESREIIDISGSRYADLVHIDDIIFADVIDGKYSIIKKSKYVEAIRQFQGEYVDVLYIIIDDDSRWILIVEENRDIYVDNKLYSRMG